MADRGRGRRTRGRPGPGRAGPSRSFAGGAPGRRLGGSANTNMEVAIYQTPASPVRPYLPGFHPNQAGIRREANQTARDAEVRIGQSLVAGHTEVLAGQAMMESDADGQFMNETRATETQIIHSFREATGHVQKNLQDQRVAVTQHSNRGIEDSRVAHQARLEQWRQTQATQDAINKLEKEKAELAHQKELLRQQQEHDRIEAEHLARIADLENQRTELQRQRDMYAATYKDRDNAQMQRHFVGAADARQALERALNIRRLTSQDVKQNYLSAPGSDSRVLNILQGLPMDYQPPATPQYMLGPPPSREPESTYGGSQSSQYGGPPPSARPVYNSGRGGPSNASSVGTLDDQMRNIDDQMRALDNQMRTANIGDDQGDEEYISQGGEGGGQYMPS